MAGGVNGNYTGEKCSNCQRERVLISYDYQDKRDRRVCEKCLWDQDEQKYVGEQRFSEIENLDWFGG